jgi:hypothetical protein
MGPGLALDWGLTESLALLGALVLAAVVLQGWWKTRRARPAAAPSGLPPQGAPSQMGDDRVEPSLGARPEDDDTVPELPALRAPSRRSVRLDALIDALVPLPLDAPVSGDHVIAHLPPSRRAGSKPFYIEGLDTATGEWDAPSPGRRYSELQAGVQIVSRSGALNEIEYSEFVQKLQNFADAIGATPQVPDMLEVVDEARKLDAATHPLDAQLTVTLRSSSVAWSVGYIQQSAARHGFVPGAVPGRMVVPGNEEGAPPVLSLVVDSQAAMAALGADPQAAPVRQFTLSLDVPQTPQAAEPFPAWHRAATALADDMDALVVDDQGTPLPLSAFSGIAQELEVLYAQLEALDLPAGSPAARRLFS